LKKIIHILTILLAILGIVFIVILIRNLREENNLEAAYVKNCIDIETGMTLEEAKTIMRRGLDINYQGFDYYIGTNNDTISNLSLNYSVEGGSYIIRIEIDKRNGLVHSINCPELK
jgi:hypothetical protein